MEHTPRSTWCILPVALAAAGASACGLLRTAAETPAHLAEAVMPGSGSKGPPVEQLLPDVLRYSDLIVLRIDEASREFAAAQGTPEAEIQAATWRLETMRWATQIATGPSSLTSLLDLVVAATAARWLQEDYWIPEVWGEPARPMLVAMERSEQDGWTLMERFLDPPRVAEAREVLEAWRAQNPRLSPRSLLEFPSFLSLAEARGREQAASGLLGIVGLDPFSGLEPTARQVELARQFGQCALFFLQRAPRLVSAQVQLDLLLARRSEEVRGVLDDLERLTRSLEQVGSTAAGLSESVRLEREAAVRQVADELANEREAAIRQIGEELAGQRAGLVQDLEAAQGPLTALLRESRDTLVAAEHASTELAGAVRAVDSFAGRFEEEAEQGAPPPETEAAKPFDVTEYGASAERIGAAARELTALVSELDSSLPRFERLLDEAALRGEQSANRVLCNGLLAGLALIVAAALATLFVRRLGSRAG